MFSLNFCSVYGNVVITIRNTSKYETNRAPMLQVFFFYSMKKVKYMRTSITESNRLGQVAKKVMIAVIPHFITIITQISHGDYGRGGCESKVIMIQYKY